MTEARVQLSQPVGATTIDRFLGGKVQIVQPVNGHRAGLDAALLQAVIRDDAHGELLELGCGAGQVIFAICARAPGILATGVDIDDGILACARQGRDLIRNAGFSERIKLVRCDAAARRAEREAAGIKDNSADLLVMNPPFWTNGDLRAPNNVRRQVAHVAHASSLEAWIKTAAGVLRAHGELALVERAERLPDILAALKGRFGALAIKPVQAYSDQPAARILISARARDKSSLQLLSPLVLHKNSGDWTDEANALLRGECVLNMRDSHPGPGKKKSVTTGRMSEGSPSDPNQAWTDQ